MEELASLPAKSRELALKHFELLRPYLDGLLSLRSVAKEEGIPYRTAARWVAGYRMEGLAALARKGRSDEGVRRLATDRMVQAIEGLALERAHEADFTPKHIEQVTVDLKIRLVFSTPGQPRGRGRAIFAAPVSSCEHSGTADTKRSSHSP